MSTSPILTIIKRCLETVSAFPFLQVWKFILDREVEAPERFQAIQTYRATEAVLKQQMTFVKSMYDSGIVDEMEHGELMRRGPLLPPVVASQLLTVVALLKYHAFFWLLLLMSGYGFSGDQALNMVDGPP